MNPDKFTHKTNEALAASQELAMEAGHVQITPLHVAAILISDPSDIFRQAVSNAGGVEAGNSAERVFNQALKKLPSQSPAPDQKRLKSVEQTCSQMAS